MTRPRQAPFDNKELLRRAEHEAKRRKARGLLTTEPRRFSMEYRINGEWVEYKFRVLDNLGKDVVIREETP